MTAEVQKHLNSIFLGEVANVHNYGAFVKIPGSKLQGMVHRSQISKGEVNDVNDILQKGDKVWCKAFKMTEDGKLSLSMKVVDQGNGKDLDPNGIEIYQDEQRKKERPSGSLRKKIELGAILNTTCTKCGTKGHLSRDCFKDPSGKTYELLPDEDDEPPSETLKEDRSERKKKKKKSNSDKDSESRSHKKKSKKRRRSRSGSRTRKKHKK